MKLHTFIHENFKLDGGAMFGVVPKVLWQRTNPADEDNLIELVTRSLLIETEDKLIMIDTGMGDKQSDKFFSYYKPRNRGGAQRKLKEIGKTPVDVTDVVMTHLHFDHCGGSVKKNEEGNLTPTYPNATYWSNADHWKWAVQPNAREKASFLKENFVPLEEAGVLKFVNIPMLGKEAYVPELNLQFIFVDGHTEKQMLPLLEYKGKKLLFAADLLPTVGHISLPYVMGYDVRPLITLREKEKFLNWAANEKVYIFLEHDPQYEICTLQHTPKGVRLEKTFTLDEFINL